MLSVSTIKSVYISLHYFVRYYYEKCPEVVSEQKTVYVEIALYLINLHSVDLKAGTFHADFYLYFKGVDYIQIFLVQWHPLRCIKRFPHTRVSSNSRWNLYACYVTDRWCYQETNSCLIIVPSHAISGV